MNDVKAEMDQSAEFWRWLACAMGLLVAGCQRDMSGGPGDKRELVATTASLRATQPNAGSLQRPSASSGQPSGARLTDAVLTSGAWAESEPELLRQGVVPTAGEPSPTCVRGWSAPPRGSELRKAALDMMRAAPDERFMVDEIRYFVGPEDADVVDRGREVERWYVKARSEGQPERKQRWLVRRAGTGSGVDAIAPYESRGYGPGTWVRSDAVDPTVADPFQRPCDLGGKDQRCMGLPREVLGCLSDT